VLERRVVRIDDNLGHDRHDIAPDVPRAQLVEQRLLQDVAEAPLRHRDQEVERHLR